MMDAEINGVFIQIALNEHNCGSRNMCKEWYIAEYESKKFLHQKELVLRKFPIEGQHAHCELCWKRISMISCDAHQGYFESISKSWICEECVRNYKKLFGWIIHVD